VTDFDPTGVKVEGKGLFTAVMALFSFLLIELSSPKQCLLHFSKFAKV